MLHLSFSQKVQPMYNTASKCKETHTFLRQISHHNYSNIEKNVQKSPNCEKIYTYLRIGPFGKYFLAINFLAEFKYITKICMKIGLSDLISDITNVPKIVEMSEYRLYKMQLVTQPCT